MNLENYKTHIARLNEEQINFEGRLLNFKNECYYKLYNFIKSNLYLKFFLKEYEGTEYELNHLTYELALYGFNGLDEMAKIDKIDNVPNNYLPDFTYKKNDLLRLYKQLNGVKSFKLNCDFIIKTIISKFSIIRSYVFNDHNFDENLNFTLSKQLQEALIGKSDENGVFIYKDVIHKFLHQIQEAFDILEEHTIYYGKNEF